MASHRSTEPLYKAQIEQLNYYFHVRIKICNSPVTILSVSNRQRLNSSSIRNTRLNNLIASQNATNLSYFTKLGPPSSLPTRGVSNQACTYFTFLKRRPKSAYAYNIYNVLIRRVLNRSRGPSAWLLLLSSVASAN